MSIDITRPPTFPTGMSSSLLARAVAQGGAFTRSDALELGCSDGRLRAWCRAGELRTSGYGAYYLPAPTRSTSVSDEDFHHRRIEEVRRIRSMVLTMDESVVVTHESALLLHGLPVWSMRRERGVHLSNAGVRTRTRRTHVHLHRSAPEMPSVLIDNVWVASVAWAVAQTGCTLGLETAVIAADAGLHSGVMTPAALSDACTALVGTRGSAGLHRLPSLVDARSESPGESRLRLLVNGAGYDVTPQRVIRTEAGEFVARVDLALDHSCVLVEFDGMLKYRGEANNGALVAEKRRELMLNRLGYSVIRVVRDDLDYPDRIIGWVRTGLKHR